MFTDPYANVPYQDVTIDGVRVRAQLIRVPVHGKMFRIHPDDHRANGGDGKPAWKRVKDRESGTKRDIQPASGTAAPAVGDRQFVSDGISVSRGDGYITVRVRA